MSESEKRKNKKIIFNAILGLNLTCMYIFFVFILPEMAGGSTRNTLNTFNDYFVIPLYILIGIIIGLSSWKAVLKKS